MINGVDPLDKLPEPPPRELIVHPFVPRDGESMFIVERAVNVLDFLPGQSVAKRVLQDMIDQGVTVTLKEQRKL